MNALAHPHHAVARAIATLLLVAANAQFTAAQELLKNFVMHETPKPIPAIGFEDDQRQKRNLAEFTGKVVVLNLWATWCVPCRDEMPALDRLQEAMGGSDFAVVPLSIDRGMEKITKFYAEIGIRNLPVYIDVSGKAVRELGAVGVPTTLILDRAGQEVGRVVGPAEWDTREVAEVLKPIIAGQTEAIARASKHRDDENAAGAFTRGLQWLKALLGK
jgi:thiol-disulfide isomerase/thioredoxin